MNTETNFEYLSASAVGRLSHERRQAYFRQMQEVIFETEEEDVQAFEGDDSDEDNIPEEANLDFDGAVDDGDIDVELNSDRDSDDEVDDGDAGEASSSHESYFVSKDGTKWYKHPSTLQRKGAHNIFRDSLFSGPNPNTKNLSEKDTFFCIMSSAITDLICRYTNKRAEADCAEWNSKNPNKKPLTWEPLTDIEFYAFLGILLVMGSHKSNQEAARTLWKQNSCPLYRATMSRNRFQQILRFIRFDWHVTRAGRQEVDKAAPIADVFMMINSNLKKYYRPYESITVDEQLYGYRGRTKFTQYMPSKPAKYGIKIWWACDSATSYPLNGQIYTGKTGNVRDVNQGERVVKELVAPYKGTGRNVTMDNFFTSLPLAMELVTWKMTVVGTIKKNKRYLPDAFKAAKNRPVYSTEFGFGQNVAMCSYVPAKGRAVVLLSTMHGDNAVSGPKQKPEIIHYYNHTKGGVDTMDKMLSQYTTKRATKRWPLALFYNVLDIAALAAYIIFSSNNPEGSVKKSRRHQFLQLLGEQLCIPQIRRRAENKNIISKFHIKAAMECILGEPVAASNQMDEDFTPDDSPERDASGRIKQKGGCFLCYQQCKKKRATRQTCIKCKKPVCAQHSLTQTKCEGCHAGPSTM